MIRIVTAYADLMNQYGEYAALKLLRARLENAGETVEIVPFSLGDSVDLDNTSLLYCPAGTELSMLAARRDAKRLEQQLTNYLGGGGLALCTGNAMGLFASGVTDIDGNACEGIGWLDASLAVVPGRTYSEFIAESEQFSGKIIGSFNSSLRVDSREKPLLHVTFDAAKALHGEYEGMVKNNLLATQLTGPLLVRNPAALDDMCVRMLGHELPECREPWYLYAVSGWARACASLEAAGKKG